MARKKSSKRKPQAPSVKNAATKGAAKSGGSSKPKANPAEEVERLSDAAAAGANDEDIQALDDAPGPPEGASIDELIKKCAEAESLFRSQIARAEKAESDYNKKASSLKEDQEAAEKAKTEYEAKLEDLDNREKEMLEREEDILRRESDADAEFAKRNRESLAALESEAKELREELANRRARIAAETVEWENEYQKKLDELKSDIEHRRAAFEEKLGTRETELNEREAALVEKEAQLRKDARNLKADEDIFKENREADNDRIEKLAAARLEEKEGIISVLKERLSTARQQRKDLERKIQDREEADRRFGDRTPEEMLEELDSLQRENTDLRTSLGDRPSAAGVQRLEDLERQREQWEADRHELLSKVADLRQQLTRRNIAVTELEGLRDHKAALEASNALLTKALEEEIREVNDLIKGSDGASPFPSCTAMDNNNDLQATTATTDEVSNLANFADTIRHSMAHAPATGKALYYSEEDVRSFIGGLSMSRLHLLQGISGTGKTSLPLAFARAIGAGQALIEIQAGWRDRQDLIGHFNTFERRFYESEFLQALYKASCPQYRDIPFIVVLDEMNLSHPEQYFADLLSALEQEQQRQRLVLMTAAVEPAPALLSDGGRILNIPENVWFVGTANHDETTKDFADKTYDRAHVMELPRHRHDFDARETQPKPPVAYKALQAAFDKAIDQHLEEANKAYGFLDSALSDILGKRFRVGWGNRLERQMQNYVPVIISCGGSTGEATDHILATKLLRKIRDKHDNRPDDILALRERITSEWVQLDPKAKPDKSLGILEDELHRLGHDVQ
jgi:hypothetical protein